MNVLISTELPNKKQKKNKNKNKNKTKYKQIKQQQNKKNKIKTPRLHPSPPHRSTGKLRKQE
jgi:hypothetical protein